MVESGAMSNLVLLRGPERQQCSGSTKQGNQCRFNAKPGQDTCGVHEKPAGFSIAARVSTAEKLEAAKQQVMDLVPQAMETVKNILINGEKDADRIKAAQMILDRAVAARIEVEQANTDVRDLDAEIEDALVELGGAEDRRRTGTDG